MPWQLRTDLFLSSLGVPLGRHPRAGVLLWLPHRALLAARRRRRAALQRDAQRQQRCCRKILPGLSDTGARYKLQLPVPGPLLEIAPTALLQAVKVI